MDELAAWGRASGLQFLSLLGGEPFLHPQLPEIINHLQKASPATSLQILTGGVFKKRLLQTISSQQVGIIFNINEPCDYRNPKHFAKVIGNIEEAIKLGFKVVVGFNVWRIDFDTGFIPTLSYNLGRSGFRWAVANPQLNLHSNVVHTSQFASLSPRCFEMLEKAAALNLEAELDCPLPLCFFSENQLAWLRQYHPKTSLRMGVCDPVLDVTPELEAIRCFALSKLERVKVTDFPNEWTILEWFRQNVDSCLVSEGCFTYCKKCIHFKSGSCNGGCLGWHKYAPDLNPDTNPYQLANAMNQAIEIGQIEKVLELYQKAGERAKQDLPAFIAAAAALRLGKSEIAFRLAARVVDITRNPNLRKQALELINITSLEPDTILQIPNVPHQLLSTVSMHNLCNDRIDTITD